MAQIRKDLLKSVVYLYPNKSAAEANLHSGGSGVIIGVPMSSMPGTLFPYVVTCAHNVVDFEDGCTLRINLTKEVDGLEYRLIETKKNGWFFHGDESNDVAVYPFASQDGDDLFPLNAERWLLTKEISDEFEIGPGDETFTIGRFINHEGFVRNLPTVRFGNISMMPIEPVLHRNRTQESYLVETRSIPGYSGSPVFVHVLPFNQRPNLNNPEKSLIENITENMLISYHDWLLGIDCGVLSPEKQSPQYHTAMMAVLPSWKIMELMHSSHVSKQRTWIDSLIFEMKDQNITPSGREGLYTVGDMREFNKKRNVDDGDFVIQ